MRIGIKEQGKLFIENEEITQLRELCYVGGTDKDINQRRKKA